MININTIKTIFVFLLLMILFSCKKEKTNQDKESGNLKIEFSHSVDNLQLVKNQMVYYNAAGNKYEVSEIKYFISDLIIYYQNNSKVLINKWKTIHYIDIDYLNSLIWEIYDDLPTGKCDSVSFIFGLNEARNISFQFVNPPEVNMFWPEILGGGYHYLMINGKWKDENNQTNPFNFHLGIGQIYSGGVINTDSIIGYVHNYFKVCLPTPKLLIENGKTSLLKINMNINSWFSTPYIYNHNYWGGNIMQNQDAMNMAKENGFDVFSIVDI